MLHMGDSLTTLNLLYNLLVFGISSLKIYPVYTSSFIYIFPDLVTNNAEFGILFHFDNFFFANLSIKCHHCHTLVYAYKKLFD